MIRYYLGEDPLLANVETLLCRRSEDLEHTLDNLDRLVVKRVGESGGYGMLVGPHATPRERAEYARQVRATPADFIAWGGRGTRRHRSRPARRLQCGRTALGQAAHFPDPLRVA